jgi:hypothetical protein
MTKRRHATGSYLGFGWLGLFALLAESAHASDEIQVYNAGIDAVV